MQVVAILAVLVLDSAVAAPRPECTTVEPLNPSVDQPPSPFRYRRVGDPLASYYSNAWVRSGRVLVYNTEVILVDDGQNFVKVADLRTNVPGRESPFLRFTAASLDNRGHVLFGADWAQGRGLFLWNGATITTVADGVAPIALRRYETLTVPWLDDGVIAALGSDWHRWDLMVRDSETKLSPIAGPDNSVPGCTTPPVPLRPAVAFGRVVFGTTSRCAGIFLWSRKEGTTRVETSLEVWNQTGVSKTAVWWSDADGLHRWRSGRVKTLVPERPRGFAVDRTDSPVAYKCLRCANGASAIILIGSDGATVPVVRQGDVVAGRRITNLADLGPGAVDGNDLVFYAALDDGCAGVFKARRIPVVAFREAIIGDGPRDKPIIQRVIHQNKADVQKCFEAARRRVPDLTGKVVVALAIRPNGAVKNVALESSTLGDSKAERCITRAIAAWKFPAPSGGGVMEITYPFELRP